MAMAENGSMQKGTTIDDKTLKNDVQWSQGTGQAKFT